ncbi:primosomal protein [Gordonia sp. X0973]|uniref:primosomal protein n=1 Tax=Gordonia sp. X0973 TaxID=2742602 RepID=UPI000F529ECA|nr:primosomal protein [Gordonia sp. X0973]QKT06724.1 primosomal protein [Gordonia sp. X0973]
MAGDIVPIELGLTEGNAYTLWAPRWREDDEEWEAFLGLGENLYGFDDVAHLVGYIRSTDEEHDLVDHPEWPTVVELQGDELVPDKRHTYDLIGVPELAAEDPTPQNIADLEDALEIVRILGEVCEIAPITKFFNGNPILGAVTAGTRNFVGRDGQDLWVRIGRLIAKHWDDVIDSLDELVTTPDVDEAAVAAAEAELAAAASAEDSDEPDDDDLDLVGEDADGASALVDSDSDDDRDTEAAELLDGDIDEDDFWVNVGIDPIQITTGDGEYLSLRCYLDDEPVFLGKNGTIYVFTSVRAITRFLAEEDDHDLAKVSTFDDVRAAATDGSLEFEVFEDNVYVLPGLAEDIADGPRRIDGEQLDLAVELLLDAADYAGDDSAGEALSSTTPLGWFVDYATNPDPKRLAPSPPFDNESEVFRALVHEFEDRIERKS